ncbi:MAG: acetyltransferase [Chloroflexi bacterium]|jgi:ribosomal protein S18 acetylase RimI-like enzyme|nr:acetyltransferase [Chloroflexota bacterium]
MGRLLISVKPAEAADQSFLQAMNWQAVLASPGLIEEYGLEKLQQQEDDFWAGWDIRESPAFIAYDESGQPLGGIVLKNHDKSQVPVQGWRFGIGVAEAARGKGVGRSLIEYSLEFARQSGANYLTLFVDPANRPAASLYTTLGFQPVRKFGSLIEMRLNFQNQQV